MTTYNTGNPVPSTDARDFLDNVQNLDNFSNGPLDFYADRLGVSRQSLQGIRNASQYQILGPYGAGLQFTSYNQVFSYLGEFYAPGADLALPYTTDNSGPPEIALFRPVGDAVLRADLAAAGDPLKAAAIIGRACEAVDSILALIGAPTDKARHVSVASYHSGWAANTYGPLGASVWAWDATEPKANHNGFDKISPTVPWTGAFATMDDFQAGIGETLPGSDGCWLRIHGANDIVSWGAIPFAGVNNHLVLTRAISWAYTNNRKLRANSGTFEYGTTLDLSYPTLVLQGDGFRNTVLKCTGSGRSADAIGTRPNNGAFSFDLDLSDFTIEGNSATTDLLRLRINHARLSNINLREASNVNGCGLRIEGTVLSRFENVTCSTNTQLMTSRPLVGLILDHDPTDSRRASANTFVNCTIEGVLADGIQLIKADNNTFVGGTSENNPGVGLSILAGCRINTFTGMGFENSGYSDVFDEGEMNQFYNCYGTNGIYHGASSQGHLVRGGYWQRVEGDVAALHPDIDDIQFNFLLPATGTFVVPSVTAHVGRNIRNEQGGVQYYHTKAAIPVTPTSGILITNTYGIDADIYITGGTVSAIVEYRTGSPFLNLPVTGKFHLLPEAGVVITFTVAPTVNIVPRS
jgi:hypothetical protein